MHKIWHEYYVYVRVLSDSMSSVSLHGNETWLSDNIVCPVFITMECRAIQNDINLEDRLLYCYSNGMRFLRKMCNL